MKVRNSLPLGMVDVIMVDVVYNSTIVLQYYGAGTMVPVYVMLVVVEVFSVLVTMVVGITVETILDFEVETIVE